MLFWSFLMSCWRVFSVLFKLSSFCLISSAFSSYSEHTTIVSSRLCNTNNGMRTYEIVIFVPLLAHALHLAASEVLLLLAGLLAMLKLRFQLSACIFYKSHKLVVGRNLSALGFGYERTVLALKPLHVFNRLALLRFE